MFTILNLADSEPIKDSEGEIAVFETGQEAAKIAAELSAETGTKHQPRKLVENAAWRDREQARFDDGTYTRLGVADWILGVFTREQPDHFLHVSKNKPGFVAFTKDSAMGASDRQTIVPIEVYLDRYFSGKFDLEDRPRIIESLAAPSAVKFATTPDEIEAVYTNFDRQANAVSNSCMRYSASHFAGSIEHPTRVYGAGDLAIAYIANDAGETQHRALCCPEKKVYGRVYGVGDKLHVALRSLGYAKSTYYSEGEGSFVGARILKIEAEGCNDDVYVMPYFDESLGVKTQGDSFIMCESRRADYNAGETNGTTSSEPKEEEEEEESYFCDNCEESFSDDSDFSLVYVSQRGARGRGEQSWCSYCAENHTFRCEGTQETFSDHITSYEVNGETWSEGYFEEHGGTCERTDEHYANDALEEVITGDGDSEQGGPDAIDEHGQRYEGKIYSTYDLSFVKVVTDIDLSGHESTIDMPDFIAEQESFESETDGKRYLNALEHPNAPGQVFYQFFLIAA